MKKLFSGVFILLMLLSLLPTGAAAENAQRSGIQNQWVITEGAAHPEGTYVSEKQLEKLPVTIQAWVYLPKDIYASAAGTVIGNYPSKKKDSFTFSIEAEGTPQLMISTNNTDHIYTFQNATIAPDSWTHVSLVYQVDTMQLHCYLNGKQSDSIFVATPISEEVLTHKFCIAGDLRSVNQNGFKGILGDVTVYADVRTEQELAADMSDPNLEDADILLHYDLSDAQQGQDIPDMSQHGYDLRYDRTWLTPQEWDALLPEDDKNYTYSIAFLPDIQYTTEFYPDKLHYPFDYVLENQERENIQYLITLGDLTNSNTHPEWSRFLQQTSRLDGKLPYSLIQGNHDVFDTDAQPLFDQYFATGISSYYQYTKANGGFYQVDSVKNTYHLFSVGTVDYLLLNLDFGATDDVLEWANGVLAQYPERRVIAVTHGYLITDGSRVPRGDDYAPSSYLPTLNDGDALWDKLFKKHANIMMVVCGHFSSDSIVYSTATGDNGNTVHQLMMDMQSTDKLLGSVGVVTLMHFTEDGRYARLESYSTTQQKYLKESVSWLELDFGEWTGKQSPEDISTEYPTATPDVTVYVLVGAGALLVVCAVIAVILVAKKKKRK